MESALVPWKVRVALPLWPDANVIVVGLNVSVTPVTEVAESETAPANPFRLATVIVTCPEPSLDIVRLWGDAEMLKSGGGGAVTVNAYDAL